jgi:hypothetical protein
MKNFALLVAFALLAFAVPASAAETSKAVPEKAAPATTLELQIEGSVPPVEMIRPPILQYCSAVQGTSCSTVGSTQACTDVCSNHLSCTCTYYYSNPSVHFWNCDWEC